MGIKLETPSSRLDTYETYHISKTLEYDDWDVTPMLEFNSGSLEVIHFRFSKYNGDESAADSAMEEALNSLSQELEAEYGPSTVYDNDLEDMHSTVHHWESDGGGKHTVMHLSLIRYEEEHDILNLALGLFTIPKTAQE